MKRMEATTNTRFHYLYRDGANYKNAGDVTFGGVFVDEHVRRLQAAFDGGEYFIAAQIRVPEMFLWNPDADYDPDDESTFPPDLGPGKYVIWEDFDHCWHEFDELELTEDAASDPRTIEEFVAEVERAARAGWQIFNPADRKGARPPC